MTEQIAQLTGRRFLTGYASDEAQYQALMTAAVTVAKARNLTPSIALRVDLTLQDGKIKIQPTHHKSLEHYTGISNDGPEIQYVPEDISDAALGVAVMEGLRRCISSVK